MWQSIPSDQPPSNTRQVMVYARNRRHKFLAHYDRPRAGWVYDHESEITQDQISHWWEVPDDGEV
jgi:hypothetical protein